MFGVYELQLPQALTGGLSSASQRLLPASLPVYS